MLHAPVIMHIKHSPLFFYLFAHLSDETTQTPNIYEHIYTTLHTCANRALLLFRSGIAGARAHMDAYMDGVCGGG